MRVSRVVVVLLAVLAVAAGGMLTPHVIERWEEGRLLEVLESDADVETRKAAAMELSRLGCEKAVPILIDALRSVELGDPEPQVSAFGLSGSGFRSATSLRGFNYSPPHWSHVARASSGWENNWPGQALVTYGADVFVEIAEATTTVDAAWVTSGVRYSAPNPFPDSEVASLQAFVQTLVHFDSKVVARVARGPAPLRARIYAIDVLATLEETSEEQIDVLEQAARSDDPKILLALTRALRWAVSPGLAPVRETLARRAIEVDYGDDRFKDVPGEVLITLGQLPRPGPHAIALARKYSASPYDSLVEHCQRILKKIAESER
jgi:hypothetical protein